MSKDPFTEQLELIAETAKRLSETTQLFHYTERELRKQLEIALAATPELRAIREMETELREVLNYMTEAAFVPGSVVVIDTVYYVVKEVSSDYLNLINPLIKETRRVKKESTWSLRSSAMSGMRLVHSFDEIPSAERKKIEKCIVDMRTKHWRK